MNFESISLSSEEDKERALRRKYGGEEKKPKKARDGSGQSIQR